MEHSSFRPFVFYTFCGTFIYAICAGFRDNYGIMLPAIVRANHLSFDSVSFIIAVGQLLFGVMQPVFGYLALRSSARTALCAGTLMMLAGLLLIPHATAWWQLLLSLGILLPSGTAGASFGILMSCIEPRLNGRRVHLSAGLVAAGIGFGICILSPLIQGWITGFGIANAIHLLAVVVLMLFPAIIGLTYGKAARAPADADRKESFWAIVRAGIGDPAYRRAVFGFFTCGFHMAFIQTHLFSQLAVFGMTEDAAAWSLSIYGLGVVAGSVGSGWASSRWAMSRILGCLYASRCIWVAFLLFNPSVYGLLAVIFLLGMTGVASIAPTAGLVQRLFGTMRLPTLFGIAYLVHQAGAFCSAWGGGVCMRLTGNYDAIWHVDAGLCLLAGLACFDIGRVSRGL